MGSLLGRWVEGMSCCVANKSIKCPRNKSVKRKLYIHDVFPKRLLGILFLLHRFTFEEQKASVMQNIHPFITNTVSMSMNHPSVTGSMKSFPP